MSCPPVPCSDQNVTSVSTLDGPNRWPSHQPQLKAHFGANKQTVNYDGGRVVCVVVINVVSAVMPTAVFSFTQQIFKGAVCILRSVQNDDLNQ